MDFLWRELVQAPASVPPSLGCFAFLFLLLAALWSGGNLFSDLPRPWFCSSELWPVSVPVDLGHVPLFFCGEVFLVGCLLFPGFPIFL